MPAMPSFFLSSESAVAFKTSLKVARFAEVQRGLHPEAKVCIKETAGPGPGIRRRESQQAEMRGQAGMDPMEIPSYSWDPTY